MVMLLTVDTVLFVYVLPESLLFVTLETLFISTCPPARIISIPCPQGLGLQPVLATGVGIELGPGLLDARRRLSFDSPLGSTLSLFSGNSDTFPCCATSTWR